MPADFRNPPAGAFGARPASACPAYGFSESVAGALVLDMKWLALHPDSSGIRGWYVLDMKWLALHPDSFGIRGWYIHLSPNLERLQ